MSKEYYIGLMSGTSLDGVDVALVSILDGVVELVESYYEAYSSQVRDELIALQAVAGDELNRVAKLEVILSCFFADTVNKLLNKSALCLSKVRAIGCHGQTIRHNPNGVQPYTMQIGDPNIIAANTHLDVVADFRRRDIAEGGQGAPLAPAFHHAVMRVNMPQQRGCVVNIGGIANLSVLAGRDVIGYDTGPGNGLINAWISRHKNKLYDDGGDWARTGRVCDSLLVSCLADPYFQEKAPKSTGSEYFCLDWLENKLVGDELPVDVQATLTELTARSIANALKQHESDSGRGVYLCGGGVHNVYLLSRIRTLLPGYLVKSTANIGFPPDWVEAMLFAWLAYCNIHNRPIDLTYITGSKSVAVLGGLYKHHVLNHVIE